MLAAHGHAQPAAERRNWFDDPFFQLSARAADCPEPAGPRLTEAERRMQSHSRAERGTTCWLTGNCERPNAYQYDQDIARTLQAGSGDDALTAGTSLWVTVQRRIVFIDGCVPDEALVAKLEAWAWRAPHVERVIVAVRSRRDQRPPYQLLSSP